MESCRPIAVRGLEPDGTPLGLWYLADIIDISQGGLCLLAPEGRQRCIGEWLQLDLRSHPRFGRIRTEVQLRWSATAHFALTFGVHFRDQLAALPELSVERRAERRDPNLEPWALERT